MCRCPSRGTTVAGSLLRHSPDSDGSGDLAGQADACSTGANDHAAPGAHGVDALANAEAHDTQAHELRLIAGNVGDDGRPPDREPIEGLERGMKGLRSQ